MTTCTCTLSGYMDSAPLGTVVGPLCDFCTEMLWAARLEERIVTLDDVDDAIGQRNYMDADQFEQEFERLLEQADLVTENDLERNYEYVTQDGLDEALANIRLDDYVEKDDLAEEVRSVLEDEDVAKNVVAAAVKGALSVESTMRLELRALTLRVAAAEANSAAAVEMLKAASAMVAALQLVFVKQ